MFCIIDVGLVVGKWRSPSEMVEGIQVLEGAINLGTFKDNRFHGKVLEGVKPNDKGLLYSIAEYQNGLRNGITVFYYKGGQISKAKFIDDKFIEQYY